MPNNSFEWEARASIPLRHGGWGFILDPPEQPERQDPAVSLSPEVPEVPEVPVWTPERNDFARVIGEGRISGFESLRQGEIVMIDSRASIMPRHCGYEGCQGCYRVDVHIARPAEPAHPFDWADGYSQCWGHSLEPLRPQPGVRQTVRCGNTLSSHEGCHESNARCINPVRVLAAYCRFAEAAVVEENETLFTAELAARRTERNRRIQAVASARPGDTFVISDSSLTISGMNAALISPPSRSMTLCDVYYSDIEGELYRSRARIHPASLGQQVTTWGRRNRPPGFIQFVEQPSYAGASVLVGDREVSASMDEHECDHACFEYGCSQAPSTGWSDSYSGDEEPEDYIDDIPIMSYNHRPNYIFSGNGPVFLGTELELSCGTDDLASRKARVAAATLMGSELSGRVLLKADGSISGYGFEAVFHPMSYDWILENWPVDLLRRLRADGARPHRSCGMHVHVSRSGFSDPLHSYKWIKFMYRNAREMSRMARRDPSEWASFGAGRERDAAKWYAKGGYGGERRYLAVNCMPDKTYEVRIFASTLNHNRFLGSLGLVDASVEYTRKLSTQDILQRGGWEFAPFREFVHSYKKYRPLQREMNRLLDK